MDQQESNDIESTLQTFYVVTSQTIPDYLAFVMNATFTEAERRIAQHVLSVDRTRGTKKLSLETGLPERRIREKKHRVLHKIKTIVNYWNKEGKFLCSTF